MVAALTENGDYSVFELLSEADVAVGDTVSWQNATALGSELLTNQTRGSRFQVYFQNHHVSWSQLQQQLLYSTP
jgi:plastocyanin